MTAPLVSGCATVAREYCANRRRHQLSAALLKATLINSTKWPTAPDRTAEFPNPPNFHQGFGGVSMPWAIPSPSEPDLTLEFVDTWQSRAFLEAAARHDPAALLIEGTHVDESKVESEEEVRRKLTTVVEGTKGLVVAGFAPADVDRLRTFQSVAEATDRVLILTAKQAFMVDQLLAARQLEGIDLASERLSIFRKEKKGTYAYEDHLEDRYGSRIVEASDVKAMQEGAILVASLTDMLALPAVDPVPGSVYILSSSEPFNEEMEISFDKLLAWLTRYGLPLFQVHASGHATAHDLRAAVEAIRPKKVFLVHTANPALYARFLEKLGFHAVQPEEGKAYVL